MPRGKCEYSSMEMTGNGVVSRRDTNEKPNIKESLHKGINSLDESTEIRGVQTKDVEGLVWKSSPGPGVSYGSGAPFEAAKNKIRAERAEVNATNLSKESARRGDEATQKATVDARTITHREAERDMYKRAFKRSEEGLTKATKRGRIGAIAAAVGIPAVAAGSYLFGKRGTEAKGFFDRTTPVSEADKATAEADMMKPPSEPRQFMSEAGKQRAENAMSSSYEPRQFMSEAGKQRAELGMTKGAGKRGKAQFASGEKIEIKQKGIMGPRNLQGRPKGTPRDYNITEPSHSGTTNLFGSSPSGPIGAEAGPAPSPNGLMNESENTTNFEKIYPAEPLQKRETGAGETMVSAGFPKSTQVFNGSGNSEDCIPPATGGKSPEKDDKTKSKVDSFMNNSIERKWLWGTSSDGSATNAKAQRSYEDMQRVSLDPGRRDGYVNPAYAQGTATPSPDNYTTRLTEAKDLDDSLVAKTKGVGSNILEQLRPIGNLADDIVQVGIRRIKPDYDKDSKVKSKGIFSFVKPFKKGKGEIAEDILEALDTGKDIHGMIEGGDEPPKKKGTKTKGIGRKIVDAADYWAHGTSGEARFVQDKTRKLAKVAGVIGAGVVGGDIANRMQDKRRKAEEKSFKSHLVAGGIGAVAGGLAGRAAALPSKAEDEPLPERYGETRRQNFNQKAKIGKKLGTVGGFTKDTQRKK